MKVATLRGEWHVRRRWAPRHLGSHTIWARFLHRSRKARRRSSELGDNPFALDIAEAFAVVAVIAVVLFSIFLGIPFLIALGEFLFVVLLALAGFIGRVLFRRPWIVDAVSPGGAHDEWSVVGWRASGAARQFVAERITATGTIPTADEVSASVLAG